MAKKHRKDRSKPNVGTTVIVRVRIKTKKQLGRITKRLGCSNAEALERILDHLDTLTQMERDEVMRLNGKT
jgi:dephospho-CoA kinase